MRILLVCLVLVCSSFAQLPNAPSAGKHPYLSPFKDSFFWSGTLFHTSSVLADVHHSQDCQADHTCFEVNPGADKYKNRIPEIVLVGVADYGCSLMLSNHRHWRVLCMAAPVTVGILHWRDATHIYQR